MTRKNRSSGLLIGRQCRACMIALVVSLAGITAVPIQAQVLYGSLVGTIEDQSGAIVPKAVVSITHQQTGLSRSAAADENGRYTIASIPGGTYTAKVSAPGFRTVEVKNVEVNVNEVTRV